MQEYFMILLFAQLVYDKVKPVEIITFFYLSSSSNSTSGNCQTGELGLEHFSLMGISCVKKVEFHSQGPRIHGQRGGSEGSLIGGNISERKVPVSYVGG